MQNLSREDVFTLLSDDFNDLFKTRSAPYSKIIYLSMYEVWHTEVSVILP